MTSEQAAAIKEIINSIFEGIIAIIVIVGAGYVAATNPANTALCTMAGTAIGSVTVFWFGQRANTKTTNGNLTMLSNLANQLGQAQAQAGAAIALATDAAKGYPPKSAIATSTTGPAPATAEIVSGKVA